MGAGAMSGHGSARAAGAPGPAEARVRRALPSERGLLVALMAEFYAESGFPFDAERAGAAFDQLLAAAGRGSAWLLESEGEIAGYFVLTLSFSMEFGGPSAFLDDLFVRERFRGRGLGALALARLREECESLGVRAVHLEVAPGNEAALRLYRRAGFTARGLTLLSLSLAPPLHEAE